MEISGQLHFLVALIPENNPQYVLSRRGPELFWRSEKSPKLR